MLDMKSTDLYKSEMVVMRLIITVCIFCGVAAFFTLFHGITSYINTVKMINPESVTEGYEKDIARLTLMATIIEGYVYLFLIDVVIALKYLIKSMYGFFCDVQLIRNRLYNVNNRDLVLHLSEDKDFEDSFEKFYYSSIAGQSDLKNSNTDKIRDNVSKLHEMRSGNVNKKTGEHD